MSDVLLVKMSNFCPFNPISEELRELLSNGTKSFPGDNRGLLNLDDLDTEQKQTREAWRAPQSDIIVKLPLELLALITAYLDPVDLISSLRVYFQLQSAGPDEQASWLNLK